MLFTNRIRCYFLIAVLAFMLPALSLGDTTFGPIQNITGPGGDGHISVFAADIDGDGDQDILSAADVDDRIAWYENTNGAGTFSTPKTITTAVRGARSVFAADLDGDGDIDVLSASWWDDRIAWYENIDGAGTFGPQQTITTAAYQAESVHAADLDGDGDLDVLSADGDYHIAWYENLDGAGTFGPQQSITTAAGGRKSVFAADLDGDGDLDLLSASYRDGRIAWYENTNGLGDFGPRQTITTAAYHAESVHAADLDGDGDIDVLSASYGEDPIAWYENTDGAGTFGYQHTITAAVKGAESVFAVDLDGDGDLDVLSATYDYQVAWYENTDGAGTFGPHHTVPGDLAPHGDQSVFAADLDGDGDIDVLSTAYSGGRIAWYKNTDGAGTFGPQLNITTLASGARSVFAADLDGDGDFDVLSASEHDNRIAWYENTDGAGTFGPQQTITIAAYAAQSVFAVDLDGDGDTDVLSASKGDNRIAWYENTDGAGSFGPQQTITTAATGACSVFAADLDGDGDLDVLSAFSGDDIIAWYENIDGVGTFGPEQPFTTTDTHALSVVAADIDGDGDFDVLSGSYHYEPYHDHFRIAWYENMDGDGTFGPPQTIIADARGAQSVFAADLDGDGDIDVLSASFLDHRIAWYENNDGAGTFGPQQTIAGAWGAKSVFAADLDGDGDNDVLSASWEANKIAWYENTDGAGTFGPPQTITAEAIHAQSVFAADLDGDGDIDVLSASYWDDRIAWYENLTPASRISFDFVSGRQGWKSYGYPGFSSPMFGNTLGDPGTLDTTMSDNMNQVGLWQSPGFEVVAPGAAPSRTDTERLTGEPGTTMFAATYRVMTDETDPTRVPQIRLRTTSGTGQKSEVLSIESHFDGAYSPTPEGRDYTLTFQPSANDSVFECYFDLLNFYPQDSATATVMLDLVEVKKLVEAPAYNTRFERIYSFSNNQDGWESFGMQGVFTEPTFAYDETNSRLGIGVADTEDFQFGFWGSSIDPANNVAIESDRLYWAVFTVGTDIEDPQKVPEFRLRLNESLFRASQYTNIAATGLADNVPTAGNSKEYTVFFPQNMGTGESLLCSFDLLADRSRQLLDVGSSIYVKRVEVLSQPLQP